MSLYGTGKHCNGETGIDLSARLMATRWDHNRLCHGSKTPIKQGPPQDGMELANIVIEHHRKRLRGKAGLITIYLDPTDDPTHGAQQLTFFNAHYDTY